MCGIVGKVLCQGNISSLSNESKNHALNSIRHRGPDMTGQFEDENVWFGHLRLSILDLSDAASQPMRSLDNRYVICYNGEVYNYTQLAESLNISSLRTHSDTEVVLSAFAKLGIESIKLLNGMFSFAIYDTQLQKIWLVRDRLGIKPLYYRLDEDGLSFSSEIKALLALENSESKCNFSAVHEWLYYGNSLGERTLYKGIQKLLPGHILELDLTTFETKINCYWSPRHTLSNKLTGSVDEQIVRTRNLLEQAVKNQLVSDVPVGVFLSGGIDSSAITAFASKHYSGKLATYSVGFDFDKGKNELPMAKKVAKLYGTDHHELHISGFEIADVVEKMVEHHDMPFSDAANIPLYLLANEVQGTTKVVLQGDGGDELFGGYQRYSTLSMYKVVRVISKLAKQLNRLTPYGVSHYRRQRYINALTQSDISSVMASLLTEEDPHSIPTNIFLSEFRQKIEPYDPFLRYAECQKYFSNEDLVNQMLLVDSMIILPDIFLEKVDRSTMASSLEVRVPFLDNDLVDFCMRLPSNIKVKRGQKKWLLKKSLENIVPNEVLYGKKTGFGVPYGYWLRKALRPLFYDHLAQFKQSHPGILDEARINTLYNEHLSCRRDRSFILWKILNFMIWSNKRSIQFY